MVDVGAAVVVISTCSSVPSRTGTCTIVCNGVVFVFHARCCHARDGVPMIVMFLKAVLRPDHVAVQGMDLIPTGIVELVVATAAATITATS